MKSSKNFPRNHAVLGLFFKNCSGDEGVKQSEIPRIKNDIEIDIEIEYY